MGLTPALTAHLFPSGEKEETNRICYLAGGIGVSHSTTPTAHAAVYNGISEHLDGELFGGLCIYRQQRRRNFFLYQRVRDHVQKTKVEGGEIGFILLYISPRGSNITFVVI